MALVDKQMRKEQNAGLCFQFRVNRETMGVFLNGGFVARSSSFWVMGMRLFALGELLLPYGTQRCSNWIMWSVSLRSIFHRRLIQWRAFIFLVSALYQIKHKKDNPFIINTALFIVARPK
jgi:hypothetical protein